MSDDCDCWTNARGEWVLGPTCSRRELDTWRAAMDKVSTIRFRLGQKPQRRTRFVTIDGKLRMIDYYS